MTAVKPLACPSWASPWPGSEAPPPNFSRRAKDPLPHGLTVFSRLQLASFRIKGRWFGDAFVTIQLHFHRGCNGSKLCLKMFRRAFRPRPGHTATKASTPAWGVQEVWIQGWRPRGTSESCEWADPHCSYGSRFDAAPCQPQIHKLAARCARRQAWYPLFCLHISRLVPATPAQPRTNDLRKLPGSLSSRVYLNLETA